MGYKKLKGKIQTVRVTIGRAVKGGERPIFGREWRKLGMVSMSPTEPTALE